MNPKHTPLTKRRVLVILEWCLLFMLSAGVIRAGFYLAYFGYLPEPFFEDSGDTFVDWYSPAYWAHNAGAYDKFLSVYPPLSFVFINLFSNPWCYSNPGKYERSCDPLGGWILTVFMIVNLYVAYKIFRKNAPDTAFPRALSMMIGLLYAWERGNLIIISFLVFMLGHGPFLRSTWLKWICAAASINFKPYLVLALFGRLAKRRFAWLEGAALMTATIYAASYTLLGSGTPMEVLRNIGGFAQKELRITLESMEYTTTFAVLQNVFTSQLPLTYYVGSRLVETAQFVLPLIMKVGEGGVLFCMIAALLRPNALSIYRLAALAIALLLTVTNPGSYTFSFLLFLLFLEKRNNVIIMSCIIAGYVLCSPFDIPLIPITHITVDSYLGGRTVTHSVNFTYGALVRPALILFIEYGLVIASLSDFYKARQRISRVESFDRNVIGVGTGHKGVT